MDTLLRLFDLLSHEEDYAFDRYVDAPEPTDAELDALIEALGLDFRQRGLDRLCEGINDYEMPQNRAGGVASYDDTILLEESATAC